MPWIILLTGFAVLFIGILFLIQGPPFVPSDDENADHIVKLVKSFGVKRILDMGSGDGKLVILLASQGYRVSGIELNPLLVLRSRRAIKKAGLTDKASIIWGNFWTSDISKYDVITLYAIKHIMPMLEKKLKSELHPGTHIISNYFAFPGLKPVKNIGHTRVYKI